jgi:hypothetical protein
VKKNLKKIKKRAALQKQKPLSLFISYLAPKKEEHKRETILYSSTLS